MSLLDDPALRLPIPTSLETSSRGLKRNGGSLQSRVRLRPDSRYARDMRIPAEAVGEIRDRYERDGIEVLALWIEGVGLATGVPADEVSSAV